MTSNRQLKQLMIDVVNNDNIRDYRYAKLMGLNPEIPTMISLPKKDYRTLKMISAAILAVCLSFLPASAMNTDGNNKNIRKDNLTSSNH